MSLLSVLALLLLSFLFLTLGPLLLLLISESILFKIGNDLEQGTAPPVEQLIVLGATSIIRPQLDDRLFLLAIEEFKFVLSNFD